MKTHKLVLPVALGLLIASAAPAAAQDRVARQETGGKVDLITVPEKFVQKCANCNEAEVQLGQLGKKKAASKEVRDFAEMLINDHDKARKDLLEHFKNLKIGVVATPEKEHKDLYDRLSKLEGAEFDREFMKAQVDFHNQAVQMLKAHAKSDNAQIREWAQRSTKTVEDHLKRAQEIEKNLK